MNIFVTYFTPSLQQPLQLNGGRRSVDRKLCQCSERCYMSNQKRSN